ncbi:glycosyltransferase family 25 protein [Mesorhizobium xinjiangense]|uniref:glycosyltransferase family 25 protein n=1 Tax=Mesorhizobium xinjiangense TaxID=2678685 RepID=UPI0012EE3471|nr:glycosyltransferase family 25 protein [Mesorhizobium xinjiangense]
MLPVFVINLKRSPERWAAIKDSAAGLSVHRVEAVDGREIPRQQWIDVDQDRFRRNHGRRIVAGEYGCYRSHLAALEQVVEDGCPAAIIAEDDVRLNAELADRAMALLDAAPEAGLIKLINHRTQGFMQKGVSSLGDAFGRCLHGPQGSAACYAVTREAAAKLHSSLATMWLPWDVALERGWHTGVRTFTVRRPLVELAEHRANTTICKDYADTKPPFWQRSSTAMFRAGDYVNRVGYAINAS